MAKNELAYKIVVDTSKAAQQIQYLEAEIARLKGELSTISQGSVAFDTVSQAVQGLESQLADVITEATKTGDVIVTESQQAASALDDVSNSANKAGQSIEKAGKKTKEISFEKAFQGFVKVGSAVTSSFAAAQAAIGLFGGDSTKVAEAAAKAQNALTLAISAREIAEGVGALTTVKATIAQKAKNIADTTSIGILRTLFAVIAANPLTALAVAIGAVVTAIYFLVDAESDAEKQAKAAAAAQEEYNKAVAEAGVQAELAGAKLNALQILVSQGKITFSEFAAGLKDAIPGIKDFAILGEGAAAALNKIVNAQIELTRLNAELAAAEKQYAEAAKNNNKAEEAAILQKIVNIQQARTVELGRISDVNQLIALKTELQKREEDAQRKADEARAAALLEQIRLTSELTIANQKRFATQQKLGDLNVELETKAQLELLKGLSKATDEYLSITQKLAKLREDVSQRDVKRIQDAENELTASGKKIENLGKLLDLAFKEAGVTLQKTEFKRLLQEQFQIEEGVITDLDAQFANFKNRAKFESEFIEQYTQKRVKASKNTGEALKAETEGYRSEAKALFDTLVQNEEGLIQYQAKLKVVKDELERLRKETDALAQSQAVLGGFIRANAEDITKQYQIKVGDIESNRKKVTQIQEEFDKKTLDKNRAFAADVTSLEEQLLQQGFDIRQASYEDKLALLKLFLDKEVAETENAEKKKTEAEQKRIEKIQQAIQDFQSVLNALQQTTTLFYDGQFEQLEKRYKRLQDTIIGDSEAANQKRIEAEKSYNKEKEALEKQAARTSLRISLAQSLANTAEAVTKITAELGPIGLIAAGAIVAANAAQVAIIANQLANLDSYRSGGRIKRKMAGGGFLEGPSHEQGGIKFQGGGIELEGNESIINRVSTVNYMSLLSQINQAGGGRPIGPGFDDSRIVEAIAKQRNTPIRAYVVESDITEKQQTASRLAKLSQI